MKYLKRLKIEFVKGEFKNPIKGQISGPEQIYEVFNSIKDWTKETAIGVYLNEDLIINSYEIHSVGNEFMSVITPDEIFRSAILTNSKNFILIHNHPSGRAVPSEQDRQTIHTLQLQSAVMKRNMVDFIIVGENCYWSLLEEDVQLQQIYRPAAQ